MNANELIDKINGKIPLFYQEKWDNSGLLINSDKEIKKAVVTLDISSMAVDFAKKNNADIIISHHPVIFEGIKSIDSDSAVYKLIESNISAICMHTPLDVAKNGMNSILYTLMKENLQLEDGYKIFEPTFGEEIGFGFIAELKKDIDVKTVAEILKNTLEVKGIRYCGYSERVKKIAVCSGSGSSMLEEAKKCGADTLITGDVKHDRWIAASDMKMNLIDCGHYYTENVCLPYLEEVIKNIDNKIEVLKYEKEPFEVL